MSFVPGGAVKALRNTIEFLDGYKVVGDSLTAPLEIPFSTIADTFDLSPVDSKSDVVMWLVPISSPSAKAIAFSMLIKPTFRSIVP